MGRIIKCQAFKSTIKMYFTILFASVNSAWPQLKYLFIHFPYTAEARLFDVVGFFSNIISLIWVKTYQTHISQAHTQHTIYYLHTKQNAIKTHNFSRSIYDDGQIFWFDCVHTVGHQLKVELDAVFIIYGT